MLTRSYLDALSPGMRAKLDPISRIAGEPRPEKLSSVLKNGSDTARLKNSLWPIERYKKRAESRTRVTAF